MGSFRLCRMRAERFRRSQGESFAHFAQKGSNSESAILAEDKAADVGLFRFTEGIVTANPGGPATRVGPRAN
ncbi:MAG: hypothetical protein FD180_1354 [Planctomycetota bacterium]|nr:MAG: hypothetical protein FD180_1354 [Planctomycetota bacterium]